MAKRLAKRVLLVGWDAADWKIITPLLESGKMPALAALIERGCMGNITTLNPPLSPMLWTSIVTGKWPHKHGIRGFLEPTDADPGIRPVTSTSRTCKALWNICHQAGMNTHAVGFWASHPVEPIRGICVSDQLLANPPERPSEEWPLPADSVHPQERRAVISELRIHPSEISKSDLKPFIPRLDEIDLSTDKRPTQLAEALARAASFQAVLTSILQNEQWDFIAAYFDTIDVVSHHFMPYHPPKMANVSEADFDLYQHVIRGVYHFHDLMLANLMAQIDEDTTVVLLSDHGFHSDHLRPQGPPHTASEEHQIADAPDVAWHRPMGILCMAGPHIRRDERAYSASLLDITPTILTMLGLPVGKDMDGKVLGNVFDVPVEIERIDSWDAIEGDAGQHPPDKRVQAFDQAAVLQHLVDLGYMDALSANSKKNADLAIREGNYNFAISYMEAGRPDEAYKLLEPIYRANPGRPRFATTLSQCLFLMGRVAESAEILERMIAENGSSPDRELFLGVVRFNMGKKDEALGLLSKLAVSQPNDARLHLTLGSMFINMTRPKEAVEALSRAVSIDESNARVHDHLAQAYLMMEQYDEAAQAALSAVGLVHHLPSAHLHLGMALSHMGENRKAIGPLEMAARMDPTLVDAHRYLATAHRAIFDHENAKKHRDLADQLMKSQQSKKSTQIPSV